MRGKKTVRIILDTAMTAALPALMAYNLIGETFHEITGIVMFALFIVHLILNGRFYRSFGKGKVSAFRIVQSSVNVALLVIMFVLPISGIMISRHIFTFLPTDSITSISRMVHLAVSYWGFVIMSFHAGLHIGVGKRFLRKMSAGRVAGHVILLAAMGYGVFAFIRRGIGIYMFLRSQFVFFDYSEPVVFFIIDYVAIMVLFAGVGYFVRKVLLRRG